MAVALTFEPALPAPGRRVGLRRQAINHNDPDRFGGRAEKDNYEQCDSKC